jgi:RNA polymerase sigma factor (sigma-70 family)
MPDPDDSNPPAGDIPRLAEHLFRHEAGKLVAALTGVFGLDRLQLAEDVVQEALVRALQTWPYRGVPEKPAAWLMQTAKHLALDVVRREKRFFEKQPEIIASVEQSLAGTSPEELPRFDEEMRDGRLRLMFACCHPAISEESQAALALKTVCGFSPKEIAAAFLTSEAAIVKRLTRARQSIQEQGIAFEIPAGEELAERLGGVLKIVYLVFSEGYKASAGDALVRVDLWVEALRLGVLLTQHPATDQPESRALVALMYLNAARLPARLDEQGRIVRLFKQDRSLWDRKLIARGLNYLAAAATGETLSEYHLQAGIAACHCTAPNYAATDWKTILAHYDEWIRRTGSPLVALNRAVAVAQLHGPAAGIAAIEAIGDRRQIESYYLTYAILGEFEAQLHHFDVAVGHLRKAMGLAEVTSERALLSDRIEEIKAGRYAGASGAVLSPKDDDRSSEPIQAAGSLRSSSLLSSRVPRSI